MEKKERPKILLSSSYKVTTGCGNLYIHITYLEDKIPLEVFATLGKAGGCLTGQNEALTRAISIGLRYDISPREYIKQLKGIQCPNPVMFPPEKRILSCADAIGKTLESFIES